MERWTQKGHFEPSEKRKTRVSKNIKEHPALKKEWLFKPAIFAIVGEPGTGKTSVADMMVNIYKKPNILKVGQVLRAETQTLNQVGYIERPVSDDIDFDNEQIRIIKGSTPDEPWIIESRLVGYWASKHRAENDFPILIIKLTAEDEVRYKRIQKRLEKDGQHFSIEEIQKQEKDRSLKDREQWTKGHPELKNIDPFDEKFVDFTIDTTNLTVVQVFDTIHKLLQGFKLVEPKNPDDIEDLPKSGTVFDAENHPQPPPA